MSPPLHSRQVFFSANAAKEGDVVALSQEDAHHLRRVLRLSPGAPLRAVERDSGRLFESSLRDKSGATAINLTKELTPQKETSPVTSLLFAHCKGKATDLVVEKATEVGCRHIVIWHAERSVPSPLEARPLQERLARWSRIVESAARQCCRTSIPHVSYATSLNEALRLASDQGADARHTSFLVSALTPEARHPSQLPPLEQARVLVIGPEGDMTAQEYKLLWETNFLAITLGNQRLRAETAALFTIGALFGAAG